MSADSPGNVGPPADRRRRLLLLVILPLILFAGVALLVIFLLTNKEDQRPQPGNDRDEVAIAYVNAINVGDPVTVCRLETERQRNASQEACEKDREYLKERNVKADEPKVTATKEFAEGVGVLVEYHLTTGGSTPSRDALRLMEQADGSWLVDQAEDADSDDMATGDPLGVALGERRGTS